MILTPENWAQHALALDDKGMSVGPHSTLAVRWSFRGMLIKLHSDHRTVKAVVYGHILSMKLRPYRLDVLNRKYPVEILNLILEETITTIEGQRNDGKE